MVRKGKVAVKNYTKITNRARGRDRRVRWIIGECRDGRISNFIELTRKTNE